MIQKATNSFADTEVRKLRIVIIRPKKMLHERPLRRAAVQQLDVRFGPSLPVVHGYESPDRCDAEIGSKERTLTDAS